MGVTEIGIWFKCRTIKKEIATIQKIDLNQQEKPPSETEKETERKVCACPRKRCPLWIVYFRAIDISGGEVQERLSQNVSRTLCRSPRPRPPPCAESYKNNMHEPTRHTNPAPELRKSRCRMHTHAHLTSPPSQEIDMYEEKTPQITRLRAAKF